MYWKLFAYHCWKFVIISKVFIILPERIATRIIYAELLAKHNLI